MKRYAIAGITIFMLFFSTMAYSFTLDTLQQKFSQYPITRADFIQERHIKGLTKPLYSKGTMIVSQELGLWWQQKTPFVMTLKMNQIRMEQSIADQTPQIITAQDQPQLFQFNSLLTAIFNADKKTLENNFALTLTSNEQEWQLTLTPKTSPLNKIFNQIQLNGSKHLSQIIIDDMQQDQTVIKFTNHNTAPLNQYEQQLFN